MINFEKEFKKTLKIIKKPYKKEDYKVLILALILIVICFLIILFSS